MKNTFKTCFHLLFWLTLSITNANSGKLNFSQVPLYLSNGVDPNVMFVMDDSAQAISEILPNELNFWNVLGTIDFASCVFSPELVCEYNNSGYVTWTFPRVNNIDGTPVYPTLNGRLNVATVDGLRFSDTRWPAYAAMTRSPQVNTIFYDPSITYQPWLKPDGSRFPNARPDRANHDPLYTFVFRSLDLTNEITAEERWAECQRNSYQTNRCTNTIEWKTFWPATYFYHTGGDIWDANNYERVFITVSTPEYSGHGRESRTDCAAATSCTYAEEIQNFANWYTYHRSRVLALRGAITEAVLTEGNNLRIGFGAQNARSRTTVDGSHRSTILAGVRSYPETDLSNFFDRLYQYPLSEGVNQMRIALADTGWYFTDGSRRGPWSLTPGTDNFQPQPICRKNHTILINHTYWDDISDDFDRSNRSSGNHDNTRSILHKNSDGRSYQYIPGPPFADNRRDTLADIAMYWWLEDLRNDFDNQVPTTPKNPAFWQHMSTSVAGLYGGVTGTLDPEAAFAAIQDRAVINWPNPFSRPSRGENTAQIDDMLHAAVNSRGEFFNAEDPATFTEKLKEMLINIRRESSTSVPTTLTSGSTYGNFRVFEAGFNSEDWTGQLLAYPLLSNGTLGAVEWDAGTLIPQADSRVIVTSRGGNGIPFRWSSLSASQQSQLQSEDALNYVRGDQSKEFANGGTFRDRTRLLGDIVNSSPVFSGAPTSNYPNNWGHGAAENAQPYREFRLQQANRTPLVLVGANDGMLHGFNADTGVELFAYVPSSVLPNLHLLTEYNYTHQNYVDATPTIADAFINGSWRTILVSGLGAGGQGVFALDITDPKSFSTEEGARDNVLWEFTELDDRDMGYMLSQPSIVRLNNGSWAAIFSGGYKDTSYKGEPFLDFVNNRLSGNAVLYVVDLATGNLIKKFDTEEGQALDPTRGGRPNGLASPAVVDLTGNRIADAIYAGDLFGNLWKINLASSDPDAWDFHAHRDPHFVGDLFYSRRPQPLFTASIAARSPQAITTRPQVIRHPSASGYLVLFGTGQYMERGDNSATNQITQSFYGIWDKARPSQPTIARSSLLQQRILFQGRQGDSNFRVTSDNTIDWSRHNGWFINLGFGGNNLGERQVSDAVVRGNKIIFNTLIPSADPCKIGGSSWHMELDVFSGARLGFSPFDVNNDGVFDINDFINIAGEDRTLPASGRESTLGILSRPTILSGIAEQGGGYTLLTGVSGGTEVVRENPGPRGMPGRQSWHPLYFNFQ